MIASELMVTIFPVGRVQDLRHFVGRCIFSVPDRVIPEFLEQLVSEVLSWPHIEALPVSPDPLDIIPIRLEQGAASEESELVGSRLQNTMRNPF